MKTFVRTLAVIAAVSALGASARAGDEFDEALNAPSESAGVGEDAAETADGEAAGEKSSGETPASKTAEKVYHIIPYCRILDGKAEVLRPGGTVWEPIKEGKFYPLGTSYRTSGARTRLVIKFGKKVDVEIKGEASFGTRAQALGDATRTISLGSGTITVRLPRNFPDGLFVVTAPGFKVVNLKGDSRYTYTKAADGDGDTVVIRCVTGDLSIEGRHFKVLSMKVANEIKIRTSLDQLYTGLYGSRGDYVVRLDQGRRQVKDYATGETREEEKALDWKLSPQTVVRIHRAVPALGEKMAVTIMTFDAASELKNRCAFTENTVEVNSGELGPTSKKDREDIAKKAAEATETVPVEAEAAGEDSGDGSAEDAASSGGDDFDF